MKRRAIIVDVDGTLAHRVPENQGGRRFFDWDRVEEDIVDDVVRSIVNTYYNSGYKVIVLSGRDECCAEATARWLSNNGIRFDFLFMRKNKDNRKDSIVKEELYRQYVEPFLDVFFVLDDRNQVVELWRSLGLKCLQVADGDF